jgi:uncharacterized protein
MPKLLRQLTVHLILTGTLVQLAFAQTLLSDINQIKAIDNHSHVMSDESDKDFDAIACGGLEFTAPPPMRLRPDNPIYLGAWRELFGYRGLDLMNPESVRQYMTGKRKVIQERGDSYPTWILDKLNIETMLTNRVRPAATLQAPRFRWVGYGDPLLLPLSTKSLAAVDSDKRFFYKQESALLKNYLDELQVKQLPATLDQYLSTIVTPSVQRLKREGAVAIKFVAAYMRPLDFEKTDRSAAARVYARYQRGGEPSWSEYKSLQDFLFRHIAAEAGKLGLVVHIHTGGGCGHYFNLGNGNPLLLESVLNDPTLRKTNFVLVHGGYPFVRETEFLLEKPNVYADFSAQTFLLTPKALSQVLRSWLEYEPEKVLFGTDASPATPEVSWEESAWLTNKTAREALAITLQGMIDDGDITRDRAVELARMVLHDNASTLYGLGAK